MRIVKSFFVFIVDDWQADEICVAKRRGVCYNQGMKTKLLNFRDMGGLETPYGKIKCGKIFRTSPFAPKCKADKEFVENMHLDAVVDFRTPEEVKATPDVLPDGVEYVEARVFEADAPGISSTPATTVDIFHFSDDEIVAARKFVEETYAVMAYSKAYDKLFELMDEGKTFAFHCTAGKDRTGIGAMLVELAFGRTFDECLEGYLESNDHHAKNNKKIAVGLRLMGIRKTLREFVAEVLQTHERLFDIAKKSILDKYATVQEFLEAEHGVTPERVERWKQFYIEQ